MAMSAVVSGATPSRATSLVPTASSSDDCTVATKLEPKAPLCLPCNLTIREVSKRMTNFGTDTAVVLDLEGKLKGIVTDLDIVRGVAAKGWMSSFLQVSKVMTVNPRVVRVDDKALVGLCNMIAMNLRHIPVVDAESKPTGMLSITDSLRDAFRRLEEKDKEGEKKAPYSGEDNPDLASPMLQVESSDGVESRDKAKGLGEALKTMLGSTEDGAESEPNLRGVLSEQTRSFVDVKETVTSAATAIVKAKKTVAVISEGHLMGIITPKDIMMRVVAKGLNPSETLVSAVMSPRPDTLSAEMKVIDALIEVHERQYTPLPVLDAAKHTMLGVVDVMEIVQAVAAATRRSRWGAFFLGVTDMVDDDTYDSLMIPSMGRSSPGVAGSAKGDATAPKAGSLKRTSENPPISTLRLKTPVCLSDELSVAQVAEQMATLGTDVALLEGPLGDITGILTDQDVARNVFGHESSDPARIQADSLMTRQPTWMMGEDGALEALAIMIEGNFRHLPVADSVCGLLGLLDILGCLDEAIYRLEEKAKKGGEEQGSSREEQERVASVLKEPTLRDILAEQSAVFFQEQDSVATVGKVVATTGKAVLVLNEGRMTGIVTPKDILMRVVSKGLDAGTTPVKDIMISDPDTVMPDTTVVEAMRKMHENEVLYLSVRDGNSGEVLGVVEVMEILRATAGERGGDRWEAFFGNAMDTADSLCDSAFVNSLEGKVVPFEHGGVRKVRAMKFMSGSSKKMPRQNDKPVSSLGLKQPIVMSCDRNAFDVAKEMKRNRVYAALLTKKGRLVGIVTAGDLTRRVIALDKPPNGTAVGDVMTPRPVIVTLNDSAMEALELMLQNEIRHLPVVDEHCRIVGLLDMTTCVRHAILRLKKNAREAQEAAGGWFMESGDEGRRMMSPGFIYGPRHPKNKKRKVFQELMALALSDTLASQNLDDLIFSRGGRKVEYAKPSQKAKKAASLIASGKKPFVTVKGEGLQVVTVEIMAGTIAEKRDLIATSVRQISVSIPLFELASMTTMGALQRMCKCGKSIMAVREEESREDVGVVDMTEILRAVVGEEGSSGWEAFFGSAMDGEGDLAESSHASLPPTQADPADSAFLSPQSRRASEHPVNVEVPRALGPPEREAASRVEANEEAPARFAQGNYFYRVEDEAGVMHKLRASAGNLDSLRQAVGKRIGIPSGAVRLTYVDERKDTIVLASDETLQGAVDLARNSNMRYLKLMASRMLPRPPKDSDRDTSLPLITIGVSAGVVAGISLVTALLTRGAKR